MKISFQGEPGAYSHQACREMYPDAQAVACRSFEGAIAAVHEGRADLAMLPVENSTYGRVADIHSLLPDSGLHIIGEHFVRVHANLLGLPGTKIADIAEARSHTVLLGQVRKFLAEHDIVPVVTVDTAGAAREIAAEKVPAMGAFSSELAAEIHGLDVLARHIEDNDHNTTRFLVCSPTPRDPVGDEILTSFVFRVRNLPAALYKAMGGFATNGINMVKLESYMVDGSFTATQFYADIEGHQKEAAVQRAFEELEFFTSYINVLGSYPASDVRKGLA